MSEDSDPMAGFDQYLQDQVEEHFFIQEMFAHLKAFYPCDDYKKRKEGEEGCEYCSYIEEYGYEKRNK